MTSLTSTVARRLVLTVLLLISSCLVPDLVLAQANPFQTGADSVETNILAILTPIAVIAVMIAGVAALAGRISWMWPVAGMAGIALMFGAPQIVAWTRTMFGV